MEFLKQYWWIILIAILVATYFSMKERIDRLLGILKDKVTSLGSCDDTFFAKTPDGKSLSVNKADIGTTTAPDIRYYKAEVTFVQDGISDVSERIEISKDEFRALCKYIFHPPYPWYTDGSKGGISQGHTRNIGSMALGGVAKSKDAAMAEAKSKALTKIGQMRSSGSKYYVGGCDCNGYGNGHGFCCCYILKDGNTVGEACAKY